MEGTQQSPRTASAPGWLDRRPPLRAVAVAPPTRRVALAHVMAVAVGLITLLVDTASDTALTDVGLELMIVVAFAALRIVSVRRRLAISTLVLDAAGTVLLLAGTGAPASAWFFTAVAGAWWAAHVPRDRASDMWSAAFAFTYLALVVPGSVRDRLLVNALEDVSVVVIIGVRQPDAAAQRRRLRHAGRHGPHPSLVRQD
jgi:hypothetical protein